MIFRLQTPRLSSGHLDGIVVAGHAGRILSPAGPPEFGRFLLASAGLHIMLSLAVMVAGLHRPPQVVRPLVVKLVEAEAPKPAPAPARAVRGHSRERVEPRAATEAVAPKELVRLKTPLPSAVRPEPESSRAVELIDRTPVEERREAAPQRAAKDLIGDLGLPATAPSSVAQRIGGGGSGGPKSVGAPTGVAVVAGAGTRGVFDSTSGLVASGVDGGAQGSSRGDSGKSAPRNLILPLPKPAGGAIGKAGGGGGPRAIGAGASVVLPSAGSATGPSSLAGGDGESGPAQAGRAGAGRSGTALSVPLAPAVTVGVRQGARGRGPDGGGKGVPGGKFALPKYGANPLPAYPQVARERGYEGTVFLRVLVQADGQVGKLNVDRSSGHDILDRAALDSVKEWTFDPARKDKKPVESWVLLPVKFRLD